MAVAEAKVITTEVSKSAETPRIQVVTNENFNEYVAEKTGRKIEAVASPEDAAKVELERVEAEKAARLKAEEDKKKAEDDPAGELGDAVSDEAKHGLNERFKKQTEARKAAEAKAAEEKAAREKAEREVADLRARYERPQEELGPEPELSQFTDVGEYTKAIKEWTTDKTKREYAASEARASQERAWNERMTAAKTEIPDYDTRMGQGAMITPEMAEEIRSSEMGPKILLHLAEHPEDSARIRGLTIAGMIRAVAKLEATLGSAAKPQTKSEEKTPSVEISKAPEPITPLKGGTATAGILHGHDEVPKTMNYEDWKKAYNAGKIK